jgi:hypothetical protein
VIVPLCGDIVDILLSGVIQKVLLLRDDCLYLLSSLCIKRLGIVSRMMQINLYLVVNSEA